MSADSYKELKRHLGHKIVCVAYGVDANISVECETCAEVLLDYDKPTKKKKSDKLTYRVYIDICAESEEDALECASEAADEELRERGTLGDCEVFKIVEVEDEVS